MAKKILGQIAVNEGIRVQEAQTCLLCGDEGIPLYQGLRDRLFDAPGTWALMCCSKCDLVWLNPRPLASDIGKLYTEYYTHKLEDFPKKRWVSLRKAVKAKILQDQLGYLVDTQKGLLTQILSRIGPLKEIVEGSVMWLKASDKGRLLDVGCGNGQFLATMRELGWEVMGVEPDPEAVRIAKEHLGLNVLHGTIEEVKLPDDSFDAITMNHVVEHVPDPVATLAECRRLLRPGGKLVVVTPNIRSLGRHLFGEYWLHWDPPRHLFLFSPRSLRACAKRAGLTVQSLWTTSKGARSVWAASRLIREKGKLPGASGQAPGVRLRLEGLIFWAVEYTLCRVGQFGEELVLVGKK